jgi:squalene synthase HpnC
VVSEVAPIDLPLDYLIVERATSENFPVASRLLPAGVRADLMALYGWARLVDEIGDNLPGDRLAALDEVERQLRQALAAEAGAGAAAGAEAIVPVHPLVSRVAESVRRRRLPVQPLFDLVEANRQDQRVSRYQTFEDLVGYCRLSANPVGRMVLAIFGASTDERVAWSDSICTALQLVEHWQDVAEDAVVGRTYLPEEDLRRFGVAPEELLPPPAGSAGRGGRHRPAPAHCRALMAFECARARRLLDEGAPLVASLHGRSRIAVASFVAGGHAALDALGAAGFDIYADTPRAAPRRFARHLLASLARAGSPLASPSRAPGAAARPASTIGAKS